MNQKEVPWESLGIFDFKGIPDPIECFRAVPPGQCILPESVAEAVRTANIRFIKPTQPPEPSYPRDCVIILRGFDVGSDAHTVSGLLCRPATADTLLVLAHGAGAGMRHAFMEDVAAALAQRGIATLCVGVGQGVATLVEGI